MTGKGETDVKSRRRSDSCRGDPSGAIADLDEAMTVTVWAGDTKMSMMGVDEWTVPEGHWEQTFIMTLPDGMDLESFDGCLEIHFDGKAGWRR